ncbi:MAG: hypothetical protein R3321_02365 [Nitrososphaeraceae archaeon]|nr:hypothetical protein [Nitrososphaeraceae archaeon]
MKCDSCNEYFGEIIIQKDDTRLCIKCHNRKLWDKIEERRL